MQITCAHLCELPLDSSISQVSALDLKKGHTLLGHTCPSSRNDCTSWHVWLTAQLTGEESGMSQMQINMFQTTQPNQ